MTTLPFFSIFLMLLVSVMLAALKKEKASYFLMLLSFLAVSVFSFLTLIYTLKSGAFVFKMGKFPAPWGNEISAGPVEALMSLLMSQVFFTSMLMSRREISDDLPKGRICKYFASSALLLSAILALIYTNDIFTLFVFMEISMISATALVAVKDSGKAIISSIHYMFYFALGSGLVFMGIGFVYRLTGHLLFPSIREYIMNMPDGESRLPVMLSFALLFLGLGIKSALYPFSGWLPWAHANAPTPSSAILSGAVIKVYAISVIRLIYKVFTPGLCLEFGLYIPLLIFGILSMCAASVKAVYQTDMKRMAAFSSISQVGYIYMAVGFGSLAGAAAAFVQITVHSLAKSMIFSSIGRFAAVSGGSVDSRSLRGSARRAPLAGALFTMGALSLCGIPLLSGFGSKYLIFATALGAGSYIPAVLFLALSSLLTALYYVPAIINIWSEKKDAPQAETGIRLRPGGAYITGALIFLTLNALTGVFFIDLFKLIQAGIAML